MHDKSKGIFEQRQITILRQLLADDGYYVMQGRRVSGERCGLASAFGRLYAGRDKLNEASASSFYSRAPAEAGWPQAWAG